MRKIYLAAAVVTCAALGALLGNAQQASASSGDRDWSCCMNQAFEVVFCGCVSLLSDTCSTPACSG